MKVNLDKDTVYVFEVRGKDSGGGTLVDPELSGVYVAGSVYVAYQEYIENNKAYAYEYEYEYETLMEGQIERYLN